MILQYPHISTDRKPIPLKSISIFFGGLYVYINIYGYIYICIFVNIYVYIYICIYVYKFEWAKDMVPPTPVLGEAAMKISPGGVNLRRHLKAGKRQF